MLTEPVTLEHQKLICEKFYRLDLGLSEYSFPNVYLFREKHKYEVLQGQSVYVKGIHQDGCSYVMVTEPVDQLDIMEFFKLLCEIDYFYPVPASWRPLFPEDIFLVTSSPADSDYVYALDKMRHYPGRKLSGKRNLVKQFQESYNCRAEKLTQEHISAAKEVLRAWQEALEEPDEADVIACTEALDLWGKIHRLEGRIYFIDDKPVGFVIGGPLSSGVHVIDFMKALKDYKGIYQYLYQEYALQLPDTVEFINLEQDLGKPQLAQAKHSYDPDEQYEKLRVALQPEVQEKVCSGTYIPSFSFRPVSGRLNS